MESKKIWLITGCSTGFGRELAQIVAEQGEYVVAAVRKESQQEELEKLAPGFIETVVMDVRYKDQIKAGVSWIQERHGRLDVLVNNAGYGEIGPLEVIDDKKVIQQFDVNIYGPLRLIRAVMPIMRA